MRHSFSMVCSTLDLQSKMACILSGVKGSSAHQLCLKCFRYASCISVRLDQRFKA